MTTPPTLIFDLDGTLVDTAPDLISALNSVLGQEGFRTLSLEEGKTMIGAGARALLDQGLAAAGAHQTTGEIDRLFNDFLSRYTAHVADQSRPFPGAINAVERFAADGWQLAVCTNKPESVSRLLLTHLGLIDQFAAVGGGDSFGVKKPNPSHLLETISAAGGDPAMAVMVGDSETDIVTARAAKVPVIAVDFGYTIDPVSTFAPDRIISHFDELYDAVGALGVTAVG